ncbi:MAG: hypothetical protein U1E30_15615 [Rhodoblastus sp.]
MGPIVSSLVMTFVEFEHRVLPRIILPLMAGLALVAIAGRSQVQAADRNSFVINDNEGYGITECLTNGSACGRVVADAWCEAHGHGVAVAFGRADDVTGAVKADAQEDKAQGDRAKVQTVANQVRANALIVTCEN